MPRARAAAPSEPGSRTAQGLSTRAKVAAGAILLAIVLAAAWIFSGFGQPGGVPPGVATSTLPGTDPGDGDTRRGGQGQPVRGVRCESSEQLAFHIHAHLYILDDGVAQPVSRNIGVVGGGPILAPTCLYWLHTHDRSGLIHMEAPQPTTFTLGQFFDIWGQPLGPTMVARLVVPPGQALKVFVDGKPFSGDPGEVVLKRHTEVVIELGKLVDPPGYDFGRS
ncbi:MAG: hypothetical protein ABR573_06215 [Candidatus Dormibacteria bacterium]